MLIANLLIASVLVVLTFTIHFTGLVGLSAMMNRRGVHPGNLSSVAGQGAAILFMVIALFAFHSAEIWLFALTYLALGEFSSLETALYYSTSAFTTVGFGDEIITDEWRMLGAAEAMIGFLSIGWSTAFLVSVTARIRAFEAQIELHAEDPDGD